MITGFDPGRDDGAIAERTASPTGLVDADIVDLSASERRVLRDWHHHVAGDDDGRPWLPNAVRRLTVEARMTLAWDPRKAAHWEERERRRVKLSRRYFIENYGHVQPEQGAAQPFTLWPRVQAAAANSVGARDQAEVLEALERELWTIILKARQLGMTWLVLHFAFHLMAFDPATVRARILGLSKHGEDAKKLLSKARRINALLPAFLRHQEDPATRDSKSEFKLVGRGGMVSLAGSPEAARQETATMAILDEFAFVRNGNASDTWTAVIPTLGRRGRAVILSTGNGPEESPGDGQAFARLYRQARAGDEVDALAQIGRKLYPVFLPTSTDPTRDEAFHAERRRLLLTDEDYYAEYPETEDQALTGKTGTKVYPPAGINAAERLGREYDDLLERDELPPPTGEALELASDYGEYTHHLLLWPLPGGGVFVADEVVAGGSKGKTVREGAIDWHRLLADVQDDEAQPPVGLGYFDAAGVEAARTFREVVETANDGDDPEGFPLIRRWEMSSRWDRERRCKVPTVELVGVPFNRFKYGTRDYLLELFKNTERVEREGRPRTGVVVISPRCVELLRQLRGLELMEDESGRIKKGDDHGPDALIAGNAARARQHAGHLFVGTGLDKGGG